MTLPYHAMEMMAHKHQRCLGAWLLTLCPRLILSQKKKKTNQQQNLFSFLSLQLVIFDEFHLLEVGRFVDDSPQRYQFSEGNIEMRIVPGLRTTHYFLGTDT